MSTPGEEKTEKHEEHDEPVKNPVKHEESDDDDDVTPDNGGGRDAIVIPDKKH